MPLARSIPSHAASPRTAMSVRKSPPAGGPGLALSKRARVDDEDDGTPGQLITVSASNAEGKHALVRKVVRTSGLQSPIVSLQGGHEVGLAGP